MTDQEIDRWVEEHLKCPSGKEYDELSSGILKWGKDIAKKFYKLGKEDERKVNMLTGPLW